MRERKPTAEKHKREVDVPRVPGRARAARDVPARERRSTARRASLVPLHLCAFVPLYSTLDINLLTTRLARVGSVTLRPRLPRARRARRLLRSPPPSSFLAFEPHGVILSGLFPLRRFSPRCTNTSSRRLLPPSPPPSSQAPPPWPRRTRISGCVSSAPRAATADAAGSVPSGGQSTTTDSTSKRCPPPSGCAPATLTRTCVRGPSAFDARNSRTMRPRASGTASVGITSVASASRPMTRTVTGTGHPFPSAPV